MLLLLEFAYGRVLQVVVCQEKLKALGLNAASVLVFQIKALLYYLGQSQARVVQIRLHGSVTQYNYVFVQLDQHFVLIALLVVI